MKDTQYRVLQVVAGMNRGGTETMLMNHYRALDKTKVQFDFLVHTDKECAYDAEILSMGGRIFHALPIRPWTYLKYFKWLDKFFSEHHDEFSAIHGHIQENSGFALHYAKKYGVKNRLMSSHIAPKTLDYKFIFREFARLYFRNSATTYLACGEDAGRHLYKGAPFKVMKNAIDSSLFSFNPKIRNDIRKQLGIKESECLLGHVGRFNPQKNHSFIISVFNEFVTHNKNYKLAFVGDGYLIKDIQEAVDKYAINDNVLFLGSRSDVYSLLQAFDVFFMPSLYEGLPVSVIEAQAAGLPCVLSDTIDAQCDITGNIRFIPLNAPLDVWTGALLEASKYQRHDCQQEIINAGYDVKSNLKFLLPLYGIQ